METTQKALEARTEQGNGSAMGQVPAAVKALESVTVANSERKISPKNDERKHPDTMLATSVATMSLAGFKIEQVCSALRISPNTLQKHYQFEFDHGRTNLMTQVVQSLAQRAIGGSDTAAIFLAKARLGWSDRQQVELTGKDGGPIEIAQKTEIVARLAGELARGITIDHDAE